MNQLTNKTALITGGAQGLGAALSERLAREGCNVAIFDLKEEAVRKTAEAIAAATQQKTLAVAGDVTKEADIERLFAEAQKAFGPIDVVVANAAILIAEPICDRRCRKVARGDERESVRPVSDHQARLPHHEGPQDRVPSFRSTPSPGKKAARPTRPMRPASSAASAWCRAWPWKWRRTIARQRHLPRQPAGVAAVDRPGARLVRAVPQGRQGTRARRSWKRCAPTTSARSRCGRGCTYEDIGNVVTFLSSDLQLHDRAKPLT
jgi:hypothetical protein